MSTAQTNDSAEVTVPALALQLMAQSAADAAFTTNTLLDGYQQRNAELETELTLIHERIADLLAGPWMPSPDAIRRAICPSLGDIKRRMAEGGAR